MHEANCSPVTKSNNPKVLPTKGPSKWFKTVLVCEVQKLSSCARCLESLQLCDIDR